MREDQRVDVHVHDTRLGVHLMSDLVNVTGGGETGPNVKKLRDAALTDKVRNHPANEGTVVLAQCDDPWEVPDDPVGDLPVDLKVVLPAQ